MNLYLLLLVVPLCAFYSVECGCAAETRRIHEADRTNFVLCTQYRTTNCLHCKANGEYYKCDTKPAPTSDPAVYGGPIPSGYYAIGAVYTHTTKNKPWANLYPRKQDGKGWWDYYRENPDAPGSRSHIALHPGENSLGCVTVTGSSCWKNLERMLKSKTGDKITVTYSWWKSRTVNRVGILRVIDDD